MPMNYFEKLKRLVNDRINPVRDKQYDIFMCLLDGIDEGELQRFTYNDAYLYIQEHMPEARFDEVQHCVCMLDFVGRVKWLGATRRGNDYIPMFQVTKIA